MTATVAAPVPGLSVTPALVLPLSLISDPGVVGGKAHALYRLIRAGVAVPDGVVLTTRALERFLDANGLSGRVAELCAEVDASRSGSFAEVATALQGLIHAAPMPVALADEILRASLPLMGDGPLVVRSSAVGEDSATGSFAGQHDSVLGVTDGQALVAAVKQCWASYWSERALAYRMRHATMEGMAVVVQRQADASIAGVVFTDVGDGRMLVEFGDGLADGLVAGRVEPAQVVIERSVARASQLAIGDASAGALRRLRDESTVRALIAAASTVERVFGAPQDVEWVIDEAGALFIVQSRPITAAIALPELRDERASEPTVVWSNANISENFPAPVTPLLYSVASAGYSAYFRNLAHAFGLAPERIAAMEPAFRQIIGVHGARLYYNLSSIHTILRLAPFGDALASSFDAFVGTHDDPGEDEAGGESPFRDVREAVRIAVRVTRLYLSLGRRIARFERVVDEYAQRTHPDTLHLQSAEALQDALRGFMDIRCNRWLDASLADAAAMVCYGALERLVRSARPGHAADAVHTALLKAIPDVISGEPVKWLWRLSRQVRADSALRALLATNDATTVLRAIYADDRFADFRTAFDSYLDAWGFRCSSELLLTVPSFQEAPEPLVEMLQAYARVEDGSPEEALRREAADRDALMSLLLRETRFRPVGRFPLPTYAQVLRRLVPWTHAAIRFRERARHRQALLYARLRRVVLAAGEQLARRGLLATRDDVFWLNMGELDELLSGGSLLPAHVREMVEGRKAAHAIESATIPPDGFVLRRGEYYRASESLRANETPAIARAGALLRGTPACAGSVTGRATVLTDVTEASRLAPGDVLVTRQTDPGWAPAFFLIKGLVIERGGMLSHGAIIAREFGIPCVVGVKHATRRLADGARIRVDADRGEVHVLA